MTLGLCYSREEKDAKQKVYYHDLDISQTYSCATAPSLTDILVGEADLDSAIRCQLYNGYHNQQILDHPDTGNIPGIEETLAGLLSLGAFKHSFDESRSEDQ